MTEKQFLKKLKDIGFEKSGANQFFSWDGLYQLEVVEDRFVNVEYYEINRTYPFATVGTKPHEKYQIRESYDNGNYMKGELYCAFDSFDTILTVINDLIINLKKGKTK